MTHTPNELADEFPDSAQRIHDLKMSDAHFVKLVDEYHDLNREIHRMQTEVDPATTRSEEEARKRRLALKDKIAAYLRDDSLG